MTNFEPESSVTVEPEKSTTLEAEKSATFEGELAATTASEDTVQVSVTNYRLFPSTNGPATATNISGPFGTSMGFEVTENGLYLAGYWWWVCASGGQSTSAQKFALWQSDADGGGVVIAAATVTSGTLTAGWNYVALSTPIPLSASASYKATTAFTGPFPLTAGAFASGGAYAHGITNGPLFAFSDNSGSSPDQFTNYQCGYQTASSDPTVDYPIEGDSGYNGWLDIQITTGVPSGATYRLWPNYPVLPVSVNSQTTAYTLACEFKLSRSCSLKNIWFYSPSGSTSLPTKCAIWHTIAQTEVSGTENDSPSWSGAAGSGWVSCSYSGVTLPAGDYKVSVFGGGTSTEWFAVHSNYWTSGGGSNGITNGPLSAPNNASAASPGQDTYNTPTFAYPGTWSSGDNGGDYGVDVEVQ